MENKILDTVNNYYTKKVKEFGNTPKGVDWNGTESQELRFQQLCKVIEPGQDFSILDFGCGYGAMLGYMQQNFSDFNFTGLDISDEMIAQAKATNLESVNATWKTKLDDEERFDYTIASGVFNVRLDVSDEEWVKYILDTLIYINKHSKKGFSFNMLTSYSDKEYMRDYLYYADPSFFFDYCKKNFSRYVAVLHDYPLYEFTLIVKK